MRTDAAVVLYPKNIQLQLKYTHQDWRDITPSEHAKARPNVCRSVESKYIRVSPGKRHRPDTNQVPRPRACPTRHARHLTGVAHPKARPTFPRKGTVCRARENKGSHNVAAKPPLGRRKPRQTPDLAIGKKRHITTTYSQQISNCATLRPLRLAKPRPQKETFRFPYNNLPRSTPNPRTNRPHKNIIRKYLSSPHLQFKAPPLNSNRF